MRHAAQAELLFDVAIRLLALALFVSMLVAACHDVSQAWDGWFYHLPFAARLAGIESGDGYVLGHANRVRFQGFPLAAELFQGLVWRLTGRIACANLVAFASLPALAIFLRRLFGTPRHLTFLSLVAVPLVQIHATAVYVDLPANTTAAMLCLLAWRALSRTPSPKVLAFAGALAAFTANAKFQLVPITVAAATVLAVQALRPWTDPLRRRRLAIVLLSVPVVFLTPIKNAILWGNPVWPIALTVLGRPLPHVEGAYASSPAWLEHVPRQVRFLCSVLEAGLHPIASHARWSLDQWTPASDDAYRMGGFFGAYVVANVVLLFVARRTVTWKTRLAFLAFTAVVASMPQSHELRYYMVWMIVLVASNLVALGRIAPRRLAVGALLALGVVAWSTEGGYLWASGKPFAALLHDKVDARVIEGIRDGERICVARQPWTFLYAPAFHPEKRYVVQEAEDATDCAGARSVDEPAAR